MLGHWARIVALALVSVNAAGCAPRGLKAPAHDPRIWTQYLGAASRAPSAREVLGAELAPLWSADMGKPAAGALAVGERVVAVMGFDRYLTLVDWETGRRLWRRRLNTTGAAGPLLAGDRVYAVTGGQKGRIYAARLQNGAKLWSFDFRFVSAPIAVADEVVVAASENGRIVAIDTADGRVRWRRALGRPVRSGVSLIGDRVLAATDDSLFLLSLDDGHTQLVAALPGPLVAPPALAGQTVIVASPDGYIAAFAAEDLRQLWIRQVGEPIFGSPAVARDTVYAVTVTGRLWAIPLAEPDRGTAVELGVPVRAAPAPLADGVLVGTVGGEVLFAPADGSPVRRRVRVDGPIEQQPIVSRGTLLVADGRGILHVWR